MPAVQFYALAEDKLSTTAAMGDTQVPSACVKACELVADFYLKRRKCVVLCANKKQAEQVDELLWQLPTQRFVPHNLAGEGPAGGAPVEIVWDIGRLPRRPCLINLSEQMLSNPGQFQHIIDFVPVEESAKQLARQRYKQFQQAGCQMQFLPA